MRLLLRSSGDLLQDLCVHIADSLPTSNKNNENKTQIPVKKILRDKKQISTNTSNNFSFALTYTMIFSPEYSSTVYREYRIISK